MSLADGGDELWVGFADRSIGIQDRNTFLSVLEYAGQQLQTIFSFHFRRYITRNRNDIRPVVGMVLERRPISRQNELLVVDVDESLKACLAFARLKYLLFMGSCLW